MKYCSKLATASDTRGRGFRASKVTHHDHAPVPSMVESSITISIRKLVQTRHFWVWTAATLEHISLLGPEMLQVYVSKSWVEIQK